MHTSTVDWPWVGKTVSDLDVRAVAYYLSATVVSALVIYPDGRAEPEVLGKISELLPTIDAVVDGLQRTTDVARGKVRALHEFAQQSGRSLIPQSITADPPDVLVIVPHSVLHGVPLHVVHTDAGEPLCTVAGMSYAGSLTQFVQCATSNPARATTLESWHLALEPSLSAHVVGVYCADVLDSRSSRFAAVTEGVEAGLGHPVTSLGSRPYVKGYLDPWRPHEPSLDALVMVAHGYLNPDDHQLSGLLLASIDSVTGMRGAILRSMDLLSLTEEQPMLRMREEPMTFPPHEFGINRNAEVLSIAEMRNDAMSGVPLVALFGCSAGWSQVLKGDMPSSFGEVFLTLGSSTVIAPAWDIEVTATAQWAEHFFAAWSRFGWPSALSGAYATRALYEGSFPIERYGAITLRGDWL